MIRECLVVMSCVVKCVTCFEYVGWEERRNLFAELHDIALGAGL